MFIRLSFYIQYVFGIPASDVVSSAWRVTICKQPHRSGEAQFGEVHFGLKTRKQLHTLEKVCDVTHPCTVGRVTYLP